MSEPATAEVLPVLITVQGRAYIWTPEAGLDPQVALTVHRFVWREALRYEATGRRIGLEIHDLVQEGLQGALIAARRFDPAKGQRYITYAAWWIHARILDALRRSMVHVPSEASRAMCRAEGLPPVCSLDLPILEDGTTIADRLVGEDWEQATQDRVAIREIRQVIRQKLHPREQMILARRFGLGRPEETLEAIAIDLGLSRERIRQLQDKALARLRKHIHQPA